MRQVALSFQNRIRPFRDSFSLILFSLLFGFLLANIFGTFLNVLRDAVSWDGFVILGIVLFVEITNYLTYQPLKGRSRQLTSNAAIANREVIYRIVNSFKIGLLLGFFVEAFKVGS
ncbi:hypothetical protein COCOBI_pt-1140 (chloroplast) [Coccomyxa sp. Obi]|nr:hypothetical protein COCOBI_pt-1140 [Coccomyxa sp. Obi]